MYVPRSRLARGAAPASSSRPRARATRATWYSAAAGEMCGSRPLPEAVTRSTGTGRVLPGSAARSAAMRSLHGVASSAGLVGPWFEPLEAAPLYGIGEVAEGRPQKYCGLAEGLADQARPDALAVALDDAAVRLLRGSTTCPISVDDAGIERRR